MNRAADKSENVFQKNSSSFKKFFVASESEMLAFGAQIAQTANLGDCFALIGDLGAGKTCFARGFINALLLKQTEVLRTCSKSRFGESDIHHSRASEAKRIQRYGERGSTENAVEMAAKGRDFEQVLSPTFNLVCSYEIKNSNQQDLIGSEIFHFDLYRLKSSSELENIGFFEALENSITLIEWPQIAQQFLPDNLVTIEIRITCQATREILITDGR